MVLGTIDINTITVYCFPKWTIKSTLIKNFDMSLIYLIILILGLPTLYGIVVIIKEKLIKNKKLRLTRVYNRLILENKLSVEHLDILENKVIALDRVNKKLLFIDHTEQNKQELCIP